MKNEPFNNSAIYHSRKSVYDTQKKKFMFRWLTKSWKIWTVGTSANIAHWFIAPMYFPHFRMLRDRSRVSTQLAARSFFFVFFVWTFFFDQDGPCDVKDVQRSKIPGYVFITLNNGVRSHMTAPFPDWGCNDIKRFLTNPFVPGTANPWQPDKELLDHQWACDQRNVALMSTAEAWACFWKKYKNIFFYRGHPNIKLYDPPGCVKNHHQLIRSETAYRMSQFFDMDKHRSFMSPQRLNKYADPRPYINTELEVHVPIVSAFSATVKNMWPKLMSTL